MLMSKTVKTKWNPRNKKYYIDKGYHFTKIGDEFDVNVSDLSNGSRGLATVKCDYCGKLFERPWYVYVEIT